MNLLAKFACATSVFAALLALRGPATAFPLQTYLQLTDVAWASASPDGTRVAYTSQETGNWQIWVTSLDGAHRRALTSGKDSTNFAQWVPGDSHTILYAESRGGSGVDQFYYVRDDDPTPVPLFPKEQHVTHVFGAFSPDGSKLAFSSNLRKPGVFDVYVLNRTTGSVRRIFTVQGTAYATAWSRDAAQVLVRKVVNPYDDSLYVVNARTGSSRSIVPHKGQATFDSSQFGPDGRSVLCVTDLHREFKTIQRIDIVTGNIRPIAEVQHDVDQVLLSPDGQLMAYIVNREGFGDVVIADPATGKELYRPNMPPSVVESLVFTRSGHELIYSASGPAFPKVVWGYDLRTHVAAQITRPNFHGIPASSMVEPEIVHVRSFDGTVVPAWYFRPHNHPGKATVLLDIHGGPEEQDRAWFYPFAQYLASRGYALLDPNIRGSTGYGRTYLHLADGRNRENAVKDVAALRQWLIGSGGADPNGLFVNGASYGGYVVLSALYHYPKAWAGGVDVYGVADWVDFLEKTAPERRANREGIYGSLQRDRAYLASISPINHISAIVRPVLIMGGANDTIVPIAQSQRLTKELRARGVPVELHIFPNEGHGVSHVATLIAVYQYTLSFMRRYSQR